MKFLLIVFYLLFVLTVLGQKSGVIKYELTVNLHKMMKGTDAGQYIDMVPEIKTTYKKLIFNKNAALYENLPNENIDPEQPGWMRQDPDNKYYFDMQTKDVLKKLDLMGKTFLVSDSLHTIAWKMTGKSKKIDGMPVISATLEDINTIYTAWFTPTIPVQLGPETYGQLPGLILEMYNSDTSIHYMVTEVEKREVKDEEIEKPKKGKKMDFPEFKEMVIEKIKEKEEQYGRKIPYVGFSLD